MTCDVSYEQLSALAAGDLSDAALDQHVAACDNCRRRLAALRDADAVVRSLPCAEPSSGGLLSVRRALSAEVRAHTAVPDILTLDEVAAFLRVTPDELHDVAADLPAFELAGRIRVRRSQLLTWVERREKDYMRHSIASRAARAVASGWKGVA